MAEVIVDLKANTGQATAAVDELNKGIKDVGKSTEKVNTDQKQLEATLKKQENTIKVIDGAINLLGGSVELLAGSLVLSGAASKEQAEEFEKAALGAIAFADGAKRTFDGLKNLNEGLAATGGFTKTLETQFTKLFAVIKANPFVALASVLAAVAVAYEAVASEQRKNARITKEELDLNNELNKVRKESIDPLDRALEVLTDSIEQRGLEVKAIEDLKKAYPGFEAFLTRENTLNEKGILFLKTKIAIRKDEAGLSLLAQKQVEAEIKLEDRLAEIEREFGFTQQAANAKKKAREEFTNSTEVLNKKETEYLDNINKEYEQLQLLQPILDRQVEVSKQNTEQVKAEITEIINYKDAVDKRNKAIQEGIDLFIKDALGGAEISPPPPMVPSPGEPVDFLPDLEKSALSFSDYLQKLNNDLNEFFESNAGKAVGASLATAANLAKTLAESQDESSEKAFNASKKYKIAAVVTSAIQSSFEAFGAAQQFGPILGPILGLAQVAAIAIASNKAIADIKSSTFSAPGSVSTPSSGGSSGAAALAVNPAFNAGGFLGQPQGTLTPITSPQSPLRAYVVSADVTNGQQAQAQIQRRRVLGPG
jgi:hypothetical protein